MMVTEKKKKKKLYFCSALSFNRHISKRWL